MFKRLLAWLVIVCFAFSIIGPKPVSASVLNLPVAGSMIGLSPAYEPALIKGLTVHKDNPFLFDFIVDTGRSGLSGDALKTEGDRLVKYFFACLTIPEKDLWVNLSPYEKDRMVPQALGQTALGRDLLAQDYILKQLTASLIYPEKNLGKEFWDRVYARAQQEYGTTQIPVNTFNKVWIIADKASVYENNQTAFVLNGHLKVMLEEDYLALSRNVIPAKAGIQNTHSLTSNIIRQIILPELEHEVNTGRNFAMLRQIFYSQILATWYKKNLKEALLNQVYTDKSTVNGVNLKDPSVKEQIYQQYLEAYKKGVFNYIKEESNSSGQTVPRKYFSGGYRVEVSKVLEVETPAMLTAEQKRGMLQSDGSFAQLSVVENFDNAPLNQGKRPSTFNKSSNAMVVFKNVMFIEKPLKLKAENGQETSITIEKVPGKRKVNYTGHPQGEFESTIYNLRFSDGHILNLDAGYFIAVDGSSLIISKIRLPRRSEDIQAVYYFDAPAHYQVFDKPSNITRIIRYIDFRWFNPLLSALSLGVLTLKPKTATRKTIEFKNVMFLVDKRDQPNQPLRITAENGKEVSITVEEVSDQGSNKYHLKSPEGFDLTLDGGYFITVNGQNLIVSHIYRPKDPTDIYRVYSFETPDKFRILAEQQIPAILRNIKFKWLSSGLNFLTAGVFPLTSKRNPVFPSLAMMVKTAGIVGKLPSANGAMTFQYQDGMQLNKVTVMYLPQITSDEDMVSQFGKKDSMGRWKFPRLLPTTNTEAEFKKAEGVTVIETESLLDSPLTVMVLPGRAAFDHRKAQLEAGAYQRPKLVGYPVTAAMTAKDLAGVIVAFNENGMLKFGHSFTLQDITSRFDTSVPEGEIKAILDRWGQEGILNVDDETYSFKQKALQKLEKIADSYEMTGADAGILEQFFNNVLYQRQRINVLISFDDNLASAPTKGFLMPKVTGGVLAIKVWPKARPQQLIEALPDAFFNKDAMKKVVLSWPEILSKFKEISDDKSGRSVTIIGLDRVLVLLDGFNFDNKGVGSVTKSDGSLIEEHVSDFKRQLREDAKDGPIQICVVQSIRGIKIVLVLSKDRMGLFYASEKISIESRVERYSSEMSETRVSAAMSANLKEPTAAGAEKKIDRDQIKAFLESRLKIIFEKLERKRTLEINLPASNRYIGSTVKEHAGKFKITIEPTGYEKGLLRNIERELKPLAGNKKLDEIPEWQEIKEFLTKVANSAAMKTQNIKETEPGGIDLNSANMAMTVTKDANGGVQVNFDPALIVQIRKRGVSSAMPVIVRVTPMSQAQLRPLLNLPQ